mmetsp:Transcript_4864/g.8039  ORF Transcript_4864/g.8039 Transcript_4864/m.8039 type:complete len:333 (-) Transcript_4864:166-1164(-)
METTPNQDETIEWQSFYSDRAQREYFYNPKTLIVTWILPEDNKEPSYQQEQHPDGIGENREHQQRTVLVHPTQTRGGETDDTRIKRKRIIRLPCYHLSANAWTWVLLTVSIIVTVIVWWRLPAAHHVPAVNRTESSTHIFSTTANTLDEIAKDADRTIPSNNELLLEMVKEEKKLLPNKPILETIKEDDTSHKAESLKDETVEALKSRRRVFGIPHGRMSEHGRQQEAAAETEIAERQVLLREPSPPDKEEEEDSIAALASVTAATTTLLLSSLQTLSDEGLDQEDGIMDETNDDDETKPHCFVPLMPYFSRKCRTRRPLFDAQQFVDTIMQ